MHKIIFLIMLLVIIKMVWFKKESFDGTPAFLNQGCGGITDMDKCRFNPSCQVVRGTCTDKQTNTPAAFDLVIKR